jgi:hypothetical protein
LAGNVKLVVRVLTCGTAGPTGIAAIFWSVWALGVVAVVVGVVLVEAGDVDDHVHVAVVVVHLDLAVT